MSTSPEPTDAAISPGDRCRLCGVAPLRPLLALGAHPIAHHFLNAPDEEEYTHPVELAVCESCALIQLVAPVPPEMLYTEYVTLSSWKPQPHISTLLDLLEGQPRLGKASPILEVGSNDGNFLEALRAAGYQNVLGVEPAEDARASAARLDVTTIGAYFDTALATQLAETRGPFDLFVARQVLEHVEGLEEFAAAMATVLVPGSLVLIEVPNFRFALEARDYSAIWEEHVNYFTPATLARFLGDSGVRILHSSTAQFSGEILIVLGEYVGDAPLGADGEYAPGEVDVAVRFAADWSSTRTALDSFLAGCTAAGRSIAVYGAGCRSTSLINFAGVGRHIRMVVDDQVEKQGRYLPGSRLPIRSSEALADDDVDLCLLAVNAENEEKVISRHRKFVSRGGEFASLHPPSDRLVAPLRDPGRE